MQTVAHLAKHATWRSPPFLLPFVFAASDLLLKWKGSLAASDEKSRLRGEDERKFFSVPHVRVWDVRCPHFVCCQCCKKKNDDERRSRPAKQHIFFSCIGVNTTVAHIYTQAHPRQMEMEPRFHCCSNDVLKYIWCKWRRECSVTWLWVPVEDEDDTAPGDKQAGCHVVVQNCRPQCQRQGS